MIERARDGRPVRGRAGTPGPATALLTVGSALLVAVGGCVAGSEPAPEGKRDRAGDNARGGANIVGGVPGETLEIGTVVTKATANDTVELATAAEGINDAPNLTTRLRLRFTSAQRDGDAVEFRARAEYLRDKGSYTLHSEDFRVLLPKAGGGGADEPGEAFEDQYDIVAARDDGPLITLEPDNAEQEFTLTVPGAPVIGAGSAPESPDYGYIEYQTPRTLWGHRVEPPRDFVPGRLCYQEGPEWHDMPLFPETDFPCG